MTDGTHEAIRLAILVPLVATFLPIILVIEYGVLMYQEWWMWKADWDRRWRAEGHFWSGRLCGLLVQDWLVCIAGVFVTAAAVAWYFAPPEQIPWLAAGLYAVAAVIVALRV